MNRKFTEYSHFDLSEVNKEILERWEKDCVFQQSIENRKDAPTFVFYEGPPSANGMPGIHHVIARTIKDIFCRYKTMKGFQVNRKAGWDTHGLPVELGVEKSLGITKIDIGKKISVEDYNAACRREVMKYTKEWEDLTKKMGYWVDMSSPYVTCDNRYIESLWFLLKQLYSKGLLYKGYTIQPYSPAAGTGLSSHELNQPGCYRDVKDTTCIAQFKIINNKKSALLNKSENAYFLAWTTTPWTLPSNTALCVGANIDYNLVKTKNPYTHEPSVLILEKERVPAYFGGKKIETYEIIGEVKGRELEGWEYEQLFPWIKLSNAFRVICGDFVTTEDGTGIVHIAPTFGSDDDRVAKANGVPPLILTDKDGMQRPMVDLSGKFYQLQELDATFVSENVNVDLYKKYAGRFVKNAYDPNLSDTDESVDIALCMELKEQGKVFKIEKHIHSYPHCWRTDKPVLYYPLNSWFIRSTACRERMIELNGTILWKPESTGAGRFGKWLENLQDWNLSRSRYWGTPLPVWRTEDNTEEICIGSMEELFAEIEKAVAAGLMAENPFPNFKVGNYSAANYAVENIDLHRPYVDNIILVSPTGKPMKRETDLIDVWFDSGAMPFAQVHYPFETTENEIDTQAKQNFKAVFPADFIAEGVDQTRGWFFTLHAIAAMLRDSVSFKVVVSNGLILDKNGNKMSKRLGNAVDPFGTIEQYGSDPLRWYMITNASPWENLKFDIDGVEETRRKFFGTLYNTYAFFVLYANVDGFSYAEAEIPPAERPEIDRWIISLLNSLIKEVDEQYSAYEPTRAGRAISDFVNTNLSNWYVRLNRKRFWGGTYDSDKISAYQTLYTCLETVARLMSPVAPFYSDRLYLDLTGVTGKGNPVSVHLADFPVAHETLIDKELEERMDNAQRISSMALALRRKVNIKVRQPLASLLIPVFDRHQKESINAVKDLILNEINVKELNFADTAAGILVKRIKPDFKKLGPKYGKIMKDLTKTISSMSQEDIYMFEKKAAFTFDINGEQAVVELTDVEIISEDIPGWLVANEGNITVALDITVNDELRREGIARELVNRIQNLRKSSNFEITDKIIVRIARNPQIDDAVEKYREYIANQVLAVSIELVESVETPAVL
ncbi:MAG: isoleucine--tRNA ligase, partial [Bacteroidales bacterium]|nr:isoleucine--tRNA ligase [Bacteroidales bacterium]